jgi:ABC-type branched-subunit amino acid transport system substrate-binding protein
MRKLMLLILKNAPKSLFRAAVMIAALALAACQPVGIAGPAVKSGETVMVALLVPGGSGQAGEELLAQSLQNAARLAIADLGDVKIDLRVYNTAGNPAQASAVAVQAVNEGAKIILGPVFAQAANAAGVSVAGRGVSVLSFSNNTDIAGGNVFVLGPTFQNTANRLASYAVRQGKRKILVVNGKTPSEEIGRNAIARGVANAGGSVVGTIGHEFSQNLHHRSPHRCAVPPPMQSS